MSNGGLVLVKRSSQYAFIQDSGGAPMKVISRFSLSLSKCDNMFNFFSMMNVNYDQLLKIWKCYVER